MGLSLDTVCILTTGQSHCVGRCSMATCFGSLLTTVAIVCFWVVACLVQATSRGLTSFMSGQPQNEGGSSSSWSGSFVTL